MKYQNITYSHEHPRIDLSAGKNDPDCLLNGYLDCIDELKDIYAKGVTRWVDCSNHGIGVDWDNNKKIYEEVGIEIINSTGFYKTPFMPDYVSTTSVEELAEIILKDLAAGAKVIGEIGTSKDEWTKDEHKVFEAAVIAQKKTNAVIITHTTLGTLIKEQVDFFLEKGINPKKVIISHVALSNNLDALRYAVKNGFNIAFDTIGKTKYLPDETRIEFIRKLVDEGFTKQLLMSMDITRQSHLKKNGGVGYAYLLDTFIPMLERAGVSEESISTITSKNFTEILEA